MAKEKQNFSWLLEPLMAQEVIQILGLDCDLGKAVEVGARLTELSPFPNHFKQPMLKIKEPLMRLGELDELVERNWKSR